MTEKSKEERNQRALDALIVSQLRRHERCDEVDLEKLPRLTPEEKAGLDSLGPDFIDRLIAGDIAPAEVDSQDCDEELLCAGGMSFGMNRADEVDEETERKLEEKRREIIEGLQGKWDEGNGQSDS